MKLPRLPHPGNILDAKYTKEQMHAYAMKAVAQEREACAKVCEAERILGIDDERAYYGELMATAIRARGQE